MYSIVIQFNNTNDRDNSLFSGKFPDFPGTSQRTEETEGVRLQDVGFLLTVTVYGKRIKRSIHDRAN